MIEAHLTYKQAPGPGTHAEVDLNPRNGRFAVGKFSDSKYSTIHPNTPRFTTVKQSPGPSSYVEGDSLNG